MKAKRIDEEDVMRWLGNFPIDYQEINQVKEFQVYELEE